MRTLTDAQIDILQDFTNIGSTLQLTLEKFLESSEADNAIPISASSISRQFWTLQENFSYCGLTEMAACTREFQAILEILNTSYVIRSADHINESILQAFDCLINYAKNIQIGYRERSTNLFFHASLQLLGISKSQQDADDAAHKLLLDVIHEYKFKTHDYSEIVRSIFSRREFYDALNSKEVDLIKSLIEFQDRRHSLWAGRIEFQIEFGILINEFLGKPCNIRQLIFAICYHDIGMSFLPDSVLLKHTKFDAVERMQLRNHIHISRCLLSIAPDLDDAQVMIDQHHEEYNGMGYPNSLVGSNILVGAQIISMCDVYYSLTHTRPDRPYTKSAMRALLQIREFTESKFSRDVVQAAMSCIEAKLIDEFQVNKFNSLNNV